MSGVVSFVAMMHGLRMLTLVAHVPLPAQELTSAVRLMRYALPTHVLRRLMQLDRTFGVIRHISTQSAYALQQSLEVWRSYLGSNRLATSRHTPDAAMTTTPPDWGWQPAGRPTMQIQADSA